MFLGRDGTPGLPGLDGMKGDIGFAGIKGERGFPGEKTLILLFYWINFFEALFNKYETLFIIT